MHKHTTRTLATLASAGLLTLGLTACGSESTPGVLSDQPVKTSGAEMTSEATADPAAGDATAAPDDTVPEDGIVGDDATRTDDDGATGPDDSGSGVHVYEFGMTHHFDGWDVTVSKPTPFVPSEYAATDGDHTRWAKVTITLTNTSKDRALDPSMVLISATAGEQDADNVFDTENGIGDSPSTKVLPGRSVSWAEAYGYDDAGANLTVEVQNIEDMFDGGVVVLFDGKVQ